MLIIKDKSKNEVLAQDKEYEDTEVSVFVANVLYETKDNRIATRKEVFINHPDFGFVEVADLGRVYKKLLEGYSEPLDIRGQLLNQLIPVGTKKLSFHLVDSGSFEVGVDNKTGKRMCFPIFDAIIKDESFD